MKKKIFLAITVAIALSVTSCGSISKNDNALNSRKDNTSTADNAKYDKSTEVATESKEEKKSNRKNSYKDEAKNECVTNDSKVVDSSSYQYGSNEEYGIFEENGIKGVSSDPLSTFSIDVDTASYSNMRRFLMDGMLPPKDSIRIEEMVNYFTYDYNEPYGNKPVEIYGEIGKCPWNSKRYLAMIGLQAKEIQFDETKGNNLVFLIDVSGSMGQEDKLPLLKSAFKMLVKNLREEDRVSIVVYAGASGVVLNSISGEYKEEIIAVLDNLSAGGSTAGGEGIELAYRIAKKNFIENGNNRVILATDGDFNVGISSERELEKFIEEKRNQGIFLSVLGFGTGNIKDSKMEILADKGNGNYAYIDSIMEAKKVLVNEMGSTLYTVAKDVKLQVEFNPAKVKGYRLIGYDNRRLNNEDFNDDTKDAGDMGAGHTVTAFYEIIPYDSEEVVPGVDPLKYQNNVNNESDEWLNVKIRYKHPDKNTSELVSRAIGNQNIKRINSIDFDFASAVVELGLILKDSEYKGNVSIDKVINRARQGKGIDMNGYRAEFIKLAELVKELR
ncbi:vWA domain-containing protein [Oceanirhabdus sp. W0125-5]|uniref:vWA domain-containing protein n=1 Tax=Oceanirhabdus sp. W0125-5 TaxID=2999116 RepID=UPI0022F2F683|nr:VWA domain-containing protein [Oceanirhabdus sp. W0125-5]WBW98402.1 VWA domain-containing protein [Oceanirhabdus sp. W0125-5]